MASTYHWGNVYRNTNLLQIHFPKVKPPHLNFFFLRLKVWKWFWKKFSDFKFFPLILAENPHFSLISLTGKSLQKFPWIPLFPWSVGTLIHFTQLTASCCCILWSFSSCSSKAIRLWSCRLLFSCDNISMFSVSSCSEFITFRFHRLYPKRSS